MAQIINNQASVSYNYNNTTSSTLSNIVSTTVTDANSLSVVKTAVDQTFRNGESITYITTLTNNGNQTLYNVVLNDDLANGDLVYQPGTLYVYKNSVLTSVTPVTTVPLSLSLTDMNVNDVYIIVYNTAVSSFLTLAQDSITNNVTVTANGGSTTGTSVTESDSATITRENYAQLDIIKSASSSSIVSGEQLVYTFTLYNRGNEEASNVVISDDLPEGFTITSITSLINGVSYTYNTNEYTLDTNNTLTLPNATGTAINIPASTDTDVGTGIITITGTVTI